MTRVHSDGRIVSTTSPRIHRRGPGTFDSCMPGSSWSICRSGPERWRRGWRHCGPAAGKQADAMRDADLLQLAGTDTVRCSSRRPARGPATVAPPQGAWVASDHGQIPCHRTTRTGNRIYVSNNGTSQVSPPASAPDRSAGRRPAERPVSADRAVRDQQYRAALGLPPDAPLPAELGTVGGSRGGRGARINQTTNGSPSPWHTEARRAAARAVRALDD